MRFAVWATSIVVVSLAVRPANATSALQESAKAKGGSVGSLAVQTATTLAVPKDGGLWPQIGASRSLLKSNDMVNLSSVAQRGVFVRNVVISGPSRKAVVFLNSSAVATQKHSPHTRIVHCNLAEHKIMGDWTLPTNYEGFDISADGNKVLARTKNLNDEEGERLEMWTFTAAGTISRKKWTAFPDVVAWAGFVGEEFIAAVSKTGFLKIWKIATPLKLIADFSPVTGRPCTTPDSAKLAFLTGGKLAIYDPVENKIIATRPFTRGVPQSVLTFNNSAKLLANVQDGRADILDLRTGQISASMFADLKLPDHPLIPPVGWVSSHHLFHGNDLYDLSFPIAVWNYNGGEWTNPIAGKVWAILRTNSEDGRILRSFEVPHQLAANKIKASKDNPALFDLRPGDDVRVDVSGLPNLKQNEVKSTLEKRLRQLGYKINPLAKVVVEASEEKTGVKKSITYTFSANDKETFTYTYRQAILTIRKDSKVLWKQSAGLSPPFMINYRPNVKHLTIYGGPDYELFSSRALPSVVSSSKSQQAFGHSTLEATGVTDFSSSSIKNDWAKAKKDSPKRDSQKKDSQKKDKLKKDTLKKKTSK